MHKILHISFTFMFTALIIKAQPNSAWQNVSKQEAAAIIEHSKNWFQTTTSYSFTISHATYAGHEAVSPYEKQNGYFRKYSNGFHSCILGIHTIQNKNYRFTLDTSKQIILVSNPLRSFEPVSAGDLANLQKRLDKCTAIKLKTVGQVKTLRLEFPKNSPFSMYEFCLNKDGLPKSIVIYYSGEVKSVKNAEMVKPKLMIEIDNYQSTIHPYKDELNDSKYFNEKNKNVLALSDGYRKYTLLDQRVPGNNIK
ncbi:MAG TPA: hypothetical protein VF411_01505 [Bacteroidia bacterium]